ncbi:MAG: hypothetical protein V1708_03075 [Candidatus Micrarchaeota archaeon]
MKRAFFAILLLAALVQTARADIYDSYIQHTIHYCAKLTNLDEYPDYAFFHAGSPGGGSPGNFQRINASECFSFYKFNNEYIYAVEKEKYDSGISAASGGIRSLQYLTAQAVLPNNDPRTSITEEYRVSLDGNARTLSVTRISTKSEEGFVVEKGEVLFTRGRLFTFAIAALITIVLELGLAYAFGKWKGVDGKLLKAVLVGNIVSLPIVWFAMPLTPVPANAIVLVSEALAVAIEFGVIVAMAKNIGKKDASMLAFAMNVLSFIVGGIIMGAIFSPFLIYMPTTEWYTLSFALGY